MVCLNMFVGMASLLKQWLSEPEFGRAPRGTNHVRWDSDHFSTHAVQPGGTRRATEFAARLARSQGVLEHCQNVAIFGFKIGRF